ncbi:MAG: flagellar biosynthetic protein FliR [Verrucomicrobia bacterium]|nr:flagellar biosynthetic protein FliR [Verrucomicrobiota bacterium]
MEAINWLLVLVRGTALFALFPIFAGPNFPARLRVVLAALLAFLVAPQLPPVNLHQMTFGDVVLLLVMETGIGVVLGFAGRMIFFAVEAVGSVVSAETGLNLAAMLNPFSATQSQAPGMILFYLAGMIFLSLDMHHGMLLAFRETYRVLPVGAAHLHAGLFNDVLAHVSGLFLLMLQMSAPVIAISFVITLIFAVLGRAVPSMNVFSESFAVRTVAGLIVFGATLSLMAQHIANYVRRLPEDLVRVAQLLGTG